MVVVLADMLDDAVAADAVGRELVVTALTQHAETVRVVDVEQGVVLAREPRERRQVERVPRHAVDAVNADEARHRTALLEQALEIVRVLELKALHGRAACARELAALVDRLVRAGLDVDCSRAREHRDHRHVDQGDRR